MKLTRWIGLFNVLFAAAGVCTGQDLASSIAQPLNGSRLRFESTAGPSGGSETFVARAGEYDVLIDKTSVAIRAGNAHRRSFIRMTLSGADRHTSMAASDPLGATSSYLIGNDPRRWRTRVTAFERVLVRNPWPGVSVTYYGTEGHLEYDLTLDPRAQVEHVRFRFDGVKQMRIAPDGAIELTTPSGVLRQHPPFAYQSSRGIRTPIVVSYYRAGNCTIGIKLGPHDPYLPVVVDPVLSYSTYLGPTTPVQNPPFTLQNVPGDRVAVDATGNAYILGTTSTDQFPGSAGNIIGSLHGLNDLYVAKLSADGSTLLWATYLGGNGQEDPGGIAVGSDGKIYICGNTTSSDFPTTAGALRRTQSPTHDIFVAVLNPSGTALVYSTYLGGTYDQHARAIAVGPNSTAYVTGDTSSADFPTTADAYLPAALYQNAFLVKINPALSGAASLVYSTLLSSSGNNAALAIAVDTAGVAYIAGNAGFGIPTTSGAFQNARRGNGDAFAIKLDPSQAGSAGLLYSSLLGGSSPFDYACCVAVGPGGRILVAGSTGSSDFPVTAGAYQSSVLSGEQPFVAAFDPALSGNASLVYSTIVGSHFGSNIPTDMAVDTNGNVYLAGNAEDGFPTTSDAFQTTFGGGISDGFVAKLSAQGDSLIYSSYLGGSDDDGINGMALGPGNGLIVTGYTRSTNFPLVAPLINTIPTGVYQMAFVARISGGAANCTYSLSASAQSAGADSGTGSVNVITTSGCAWSAKSNTSWIGITDGAAGSGNGAVSLQIVANDSPAVRTGTLTIAGLTFTITQDAAVCTYLVLPAKIVFGPNAGSGTASFGTPSHCPSVPSFSDSWITPLSFYPRIGGPLLFAVAANTSASNRTGTIQVGTAVVTVTQAAANCTYTLRPPTLVVGSAGGAQSFAIDTQPGCPWFANTLANSELNWLQAQPTFGSGPSTMPFTFASNPYFMPRSDVIRVLDQTFTVVQNPPPQLAIVKTHTGSFFAGQNGATYTLIVSNAGASDPTSGTVTVTESLPAGMTLVSMVGNGWTCPNGGPVCTRGDVLAGGASYPSITVTVNVATSAGSPQVNSVSVSGGGSLTAGANDGTTILVAAAVLLNPTPSSTLLSTSTTFSWTPVAGADNYWLDVGNAIGQGDISAGATTAGSRSVSALPCDGRTLYVQLWTHSVSGWQTPQRYTFRAATCITAAQMSSPSPGSVLLAASAAFSWTPVAGADNYWLDVGNSIGQGDLSAGATTAATRSVSGLPCDGRTLFVQLWTHLASGWQTPQRYTYTAATCIAVAQMSLPMPGSALTGNSATFSWTVAAGADNYWLDVGNSIGQGDISAAATTAATRSVSGLPCDGRTLFVQLWTHLASGWQTPQRYTYTAATCIPVAQMSLPMPGSALTGNSAAFSWTAAAGADNYWLDVGNSIGQGDISAGSTVATSQNVSGLPCDGRTLHVQLWTHFASGWQTPQRYTYAAATCSSVAQMSLPIPGSPLSGISPTFSWTPVAGADSYWLDVGNSTGQGDISAGATTATARTVSGLPCDGRTLFVQLWTHFASGWRTPQRYTYTACH